MIEFGEGDYGSEFSGELESEMSSDMGPEIEPAAELEPTHELDSEAMSETNLEPAPDLEIEPQSDSAAQSDTVVEPAPDLPESNMPEAEGIPFSYTGPEGNYIGPEHTEIYHSPETTPEKEPGFGPKPSFPADPNLPNSTPADTKPEDPPQDNFKPTDKPDEDTQKLLDYMQKVREEEAQWLKEDLEKFENRPKPPYIK